MLSQLRIFAYLSVLLSSLALIWHHFVGRPHSFRHGWLVASAIVALVCGLILLPLSLAGLALLFGVLGFVPFGTAYIYYRNARDMFKGLSKIQIRNSVCGFMMYLTIPTVCQLMVNQFAGYVVRDIVANVDPSNGSDLDELKLLNRIGERQRLVWYYEKEADPSKRAKLAKAFRQITGQDIRYVSESMKND